MERYKEECRKISEQIEPSEEFIKNLKLNLNKKLYEEKMTRRNLLSKVAMIFFVLTVASSGVFAKDIGNWLAQLFSNTDESMQVAVESGYVQNVEMDYVENEGIAIKVNSLIIDDNKMNIVFDVKGEIDGDLGVKEVKILSSEEDCENVIGEEKNNKDNEEFVALENYSEYTIDNLNTGSTSYDRTFKTINKNNHILIIGLSNIEQKLDNIKVLNIILNDLCIMNKNNEIKEITGIWECKVKIEEDNFKNNNTLAYRYVIAENEYIENYEINKTNTGINIKLNFQKTFDRLSLINRKNIYIETDNNEKILCRDFYRISDNKINLNIPVEIKEELNKFKIVLNIENEKIIFNVKKENS